MTRRLVLGTGIASVLAGVFVVILSLSLERLIPYIVDLEAIKANVEQGIESGTGIRADIEEIAIDLTLFEGIRIVFDNNVLYSPEDVRIVKAGQVVVNVRYLPLLKGKTSISRILFQDMSVYVGERSILFRLKRPKAPSQRVFLEDAEIAFGNYHIWIDRYFDRRNQYFLNGDRLRLRHVRSEQPLELSATGTGFFGVYQPSQRIGRFDLYALGRQALLDKPNLDWKDILRFRIRFSDVSLPTLGSILTTYTAPVRAEGEVGRLQFDYRGDTSPRQLTVQGNTSTQTRFQLYGYDFEFDPGQLLFWTALALDPKARQGALNRFTLRMQSRHFSASAQGRADLKMPFEQSWVNFQLQTSWLPLRAMGLLPWHHRVLGSLGGEFATRLRIQGSPRRPHVWGRVPFRQVSVRSPDTGQVLARDVMGTLRLVNTDNLWFEGVQGIVAGSPTALSGNVNLAENTLHLAVQADRLILQQVQALWSLFYPVPERVRRLALTGQMGLNLIIQGPWMDPRLYGNAVLRDVGLLAPDRQTYTARGVSGRLVFRDHWAMSSQLKGRVDGTWVTLSGAFQRQTRWLAVRLQGQQVDVSQLRELMLAILPGASRAWVERFRVAGETSFDVQLTGPLRDPEQWDLVGDLVLSGVSLLDVATGWRVSDLLARLHFTLSTIRIVRLTARFQEIPFQMGGDITPGFERYRLWVRAQNLPIGRLQAVLKDLAPAVVSRVAALGLRKGMADLALVIDSGLPNRLGGRVTLRNLSLLPPALGMLVRLARVDYDIATGRIVIPLSHGQLDSLGFLVAGVVQGEDYRLQIRSQELPVSFIRDAGQRWARLIPFSLPTLFYTEGAFRVMAELTPGFKEVSVRFLNAGASMRELKYPLYNVNGLLTLRWNGMLQADAENLRVRYGNSPVVTSFHLLGSGQVQVVVAGQLSPLLLNEALKRMDSATVIQTAAPFETQLQGTLGTLAGTGAGNDATLNGHLQIPPLSAADALIPVSNGANAEPIRLEARLHLLEDTLYVRQFLLGLSPGSRAQVSGTVCKLFRPLEREWRLMLTTMPTLNLGPLRDYLGVTSPDVLSGLLNAQLAWVYSPSQWGLQGQAEVKNFQSEYLEISRLDGRLLLDGMQAFLDVAQFQIPGVDVRFTAYAPSVRRYPLTITSFHLIGREFVVSLFREWIQEVVVKKVRGELLRAFLPPPGGKIRLPFEITDGTLQLAEGIVNNIILEQYSSTIQVFSDTRFVLGNAEAQSAGGTLRGNFSMQPSENNRMIADLSLDRMKASAVARVLLGVRNQIFGDLSGTIRFTTEGRSTPEMLSNTYGYADLTIENGRLPSIARVETLMTAASVISGGVLGFDPAALLGLATRRNTDYFATLTGTFEVVRGVIGTRDMRVDGENLDFALTGYIRMVDGVADLLVRGRFEREFSGLLGSLGNTFLGRLFQAFAPLREALRIARGAPLLTIQGVSGVFGILAIAQVIRRLPILGAIISRIPIIGYWPGFGGRITGDGLSFEVRIIGPLTDPGSIQGFRWIP